MIRFAGKISAILLTLALAGPALAQSPQQQEDPLDILKNIALTPDGAITLTIGGQLRARAEVSRDPLFGLATPDSNDGLLFRSSISADLHLGPYYRTYLELVSGQAPAWTGSPPATQLDRLDLLQGYGELTLPIDNNKLMLRVGRQSMSFGSSRLVSVRESPNIRRAFDGVRAAWIVDEDTRIDAFLTRPVLPEAGIFDDGPDQGQAFWGIYGTTDMPGIPALKADLYYLGLNRDGARFAEGVADEHRHTVGARLFGETGGFDWNVEGDYQFGRFGDAPIRAWSASSSLGYTFADLPFSPRLGLNADLISGDGDLHDGKLGTFNPLFPRLPYFSEANLVGPANLADIQPNVTLAIRPDLKLTLGWNALWKQSEADAYYSSAIVPVAQTAGGEGHYLGQQVSATLEWNPLKHLTLGATFVVYSPGERIRAVGGDSGTYTAGWATFTF